uniref:Uncharacterized protein LOC111115354 n=1 Tax=Crassostrea virginica TaxID=6565 RepID=A0A8B8C3V2_CRAVI|nr:uncharacterized protein LOC111115354 [Crassostrea virginica]
MSTLINLLWLVLVNVMVEYRVESFLFNVHANVSGSPSDNGYYNIYSKIDSLERALQNLETSVQQKETHMDTLLRQVLLTVNEMDAKIESSGLHKIESNELRLQNMSLEIEQLKAFTKNDTAVGFTTKLYGTTYRSTFSIIRGSPILYNGGNAYNGTVFTCPSPGLYLFHVSMLSSTSDSGIWIYKNSQQLTLAYSGGDPQNNGASVSAVVWLDVGDQVYLRPYSLSLNLDPNSAFTGVKVN